jgi:protein-disulfide isomerase
MEKKNIIWAVLSTLAVFAFLTVFYVLSIGEQQKVYKEINTVNNDDHVKWSAKKQKVLVEYSDFQCPACKNFHEYLRSLEATTSSAIGIPQKVTLVFRNFPLYEIHPVSLEAAYAAEAAGKQGKFWEMADLLYANQSEWINKNYNQLFVEYAKQLGLDPERFNKDIKSQEVKDKVKKDMTSGTNIGINATPTFFLDGKKLGDFSSFDEFKKLLE